MSTTLNKLEYLDETKKEIKNALNTNFNSGITDEDTFRSYVGKINNIYTNWAKVTGEGTEITLNNTKKGKMALTPKGNTEQTTYTGKNLLTYKYELGYSTTIEGITWTINQDGTITANGTASSLSIFDFSNASNLSSLIGKTVIMNGSPSGTDNNIWVGVYTSSYSEILKATQGNDSYSALIDNTAVRVIARIPQGTTVNNLVFKPMIRLSSVTDGTYEPYVGGTPSPNPDYPQDVRVVTGDNTIIVSNSDNTQSQTYPINLGTMELCKIVNYQDYIYKDSGKWYKHSEIGKVVLDGSEYWEMYGSSGARKWYRTTFDNQNTTSQSIKMVSTSFKWSQYISGNWAINQFGYHSGANKNVFDTDFGESLEEWKTWLSTHNTIVYYPLETPTNTEITDTTLISQLNAIENAVSYDTKTNISSEYVENNAQMIISASALEKGGI